MPILYSDETVDGALDLIDAIGEKNNSGQVPLYFFFVVDEDGVEKMYIADEPITKKMVTTYERN